ncbi:MAG TPA: TIGR03435 family protein [Bryobacteraceae bacterium]|nr:TIGR03435 family protein [Bryobacteraceae bacterium]
MRLAVALTICAGLGCSQAKFEVASIKPCKADVVPEGGRGGGRESFSPGRLNLECRTVKGLIQMAYVLFADGRVHPRMVVPIEGGPGWINSERYTIDAKAEGAPSHGMMHGPMLQALLEERFHLKTHRETREIPVYALTAAKGGLKLKPFQEGSCTPIDFDSFFAQFPPPPLPEPPQGQRYCITRGTSKGLNNLVEAEATSLDLFTRDYFGGLDRPVINRTGVAGLFNFRLEYAPQETPSDDPAGAPSIFIALQQQLGLKLDAAKGPGEFLVIDRVQKPTEN